MKPEYEIKFFVDKNDFKKTLLTHNALLYKPRTLMKRQTFHFDNQPNKWARIRDEGDKVTLTIKKLDDSQSINGTKEIEISIDSFDNGCKVLLETGLIARSYQENYRETWKYDDCIITLDEWPGLNAFIEIEGNSQNDVYRTSQKLGFDIRKGLYGSIDLLYYEQLNIAPREFNTTPRLTFANADTILQKLIA